MMEGIKEGDATKVESNIKSFDADPNDAAGDLGLKPLVYAASRGDPTVIKTLIECKADVNGADDKGRTPLHQANNPCSPPQNSRLVSQSTRSSTLILQAVSSDNWKAVEIFLEAGCDPSAINPWGQSAVHLAAKEASLEVLQAVLDAGGDPRPEGLYGRTPLKWAALAGHKEESGHIKALKAAIEDCESRESAKWQTIALTVVLVVAMEAGSGLVSRTFVWLACSPSWFSMKQDIMGESRGGKGFSDEVLDSIYEEKCDLGLFAGKIMMCLVIGWMLFLIVLWWKYNLQWKAYR